MSELKLIHTKDGIQLVGPCDEFANLMPLLDLPPPLRLSLRGLTSINSIGIRHWIVFVKQWGKKTLEFHECPECFIETVNVVESMLGVDYTGRRVKSMLVPYACDACSSQSISLVKTSEIRLEDDEAIPPGRACAQCGKSARINTGSEDHFFFLTCLPNESNG